MESYLCNRYLFVVPNGQDSSLYLITAGVLQGGVWSPVLFNLYVRHLPSQLKSCLLVSYVDDSTLLKVIPTKDLRLSVAIEINADLCGIADWGRRWHIEFKSLESNALCVSLKHDVEEHPPLFMNGVLIKESKVLSILGFHFDSRLTWDYVYDRFYSAMLQTETGWDVLEEYQSILPQRVCPWPIGLLYVRLQSMVGCYYWEPVPPNYLNWTVCSSLLNSYAHHHLYLFPGVVMLVP